MTKYLNICLVLKSADQDVYCFLLCLQMHTNKWYNAFNVCSGTVSLTDNRAQGDGGKHCAYRTLQVG